MMRDGNSSTIEDRWTLCAKERWTFHNGSALVSGSRFARQGECLEWGERILWSRNSEQVWNASPSLDSGLPHCTRNSVGTSGHVFENPPASRKNISVLTRSCRETWRRIETRTAEFNNTVSTIFQESWCLDFCSSYWRNLFSKLYDGKYDVFHVGIAFRKIPRPRWLSVCVSTSTPELTMSWNNEVEMAKSTDDLMTSQSIEGKSFPDFEMLDTSIASALSSFRRRVSDWSMATFNRSLWYSSRSIGFVQCLLTEWWRPRFRYKMGSDLVRNKWNAFGKRPRRSYKN